ncbi:VCBS repeat-containing protein [bacterium]|nr:VCBS repeat-containing protein [bacterium]
MKRNVTIIAAAMLCLFVFAGLQAQTFTRSLVIPPPEPTLNNGGIGDMIAGVDLDNDGLLEIYLVNDNWNDTPSEVIPRIYKLEQTAADNYTDWPIVWQGAPPVAMQNTWPPLAVADLDGDGKQEIVWGIVNNTGVEANPYRIVVYEVAGDGSDNLGVDVGGGVFGPNAKWTITDQDGMNIRTSDIDIADPDGDGVAEICFSDRTGNTDGVYFGVISVDDIPDNGDGSETWTMEVSGWDYGDLASEPIENKWDVSVIGHNMYTFCEVEISKLAWDGAAWSYTALNPLAGGSTFLSSQVADLDFDGTEEIIAGVYDWGDDAQKGIVLLQEDGDDLVHTPLVNVLSYFPGGSRGLLGSAQGDIDNDGYLDFIFGARAATPNGAIFMLSYKGGDITDPASYTFAVIDSNYAEDGIWNVVQVANVDGDDELEVLYTSSTDAGVFPNKGTQGVIVLDYNPGTGVFDKRVLVLGYSLNQNYPNPFNPTTTISYTIPANEFVTLKIYNIMGQEIKTLVNGIQPAGVNEVQWDGTNDLEQQVASGTYITWMNAGNQIKTRTITLMK